ncbi:MAG: hypothetical protein M1818_000874 [Claussenomyces sp. TS43310]|nr:MAG: hypothetical protein M1818_000874 [Claussenomyces sp. TS43310]
MPYIAQKYDPPLWAASRKWSVLQYIISSLQKLATLRNIVVVILTQSITKMQSGSGAVLIPAVSSTAWDSGIATRIVLFRDWGWEKTQVRFARIVKASGTSTKGREGVGRIIPFVIDDRGLQEVQTPESTSIVTTSMTGILGRKRKADDIRDSEDEDDLEGSDEDYGWAEDDVEKLPPPPSQWQGSEDILFPLPDDRAEDEEQEHFLDDEDEDEVVVVRTGASNEDDSREDLHDGDAHRASYG